MVHSAHALHYINHRSCKINHSFSVLTHSFLDPDLYDTLTEEMLVEKISQSMGHMDKEELVAQITKLVSSDTNGSDKHVWQHWVEHVANKQHLLTDLHFEF